MCDRGSLYPVRLRRWLAAVCSCLIAATGWAGVSIPSFAEYDPSAAGAAPVVAMPAVGIIGICIVVVVCVVAGALIIMRHDK